MLRRPFDNETLEDYISINMIELKNEIENEELIIW